MLHLMHDMRTRLESVRWERRVKWGSKHSDWLIVTNCLWHWSLWCTDTQIHADTFASRRTDVLFFVHLVCNKSFLQHHSFTQSAFQVSQSVRIVFTASSCLPHHRPYSWASFRRQVVTTLPASPPCHQENSLSSHTIHMLLKETAWTGIV